MGTDHAYAVAYARSLSNRLLSGAELDRLSEMDSRGAAEYLRSAGYFDGIVSSRSELDAELSSQLRRAWNDILSACGGDTPLDILLIRNDFHNLKAAFKCGMIGLDPAGLMKEPSLYPSALAVLAAGGSFGSVGEPLRSAAEGAYELLSKTNDAQLADMYLDKAYFSWSYKRAKSSRSRFFEGYISREAELTDIGTAARCLREKRNRSFIENALVSPENSTITLARARDVDELCSMLEKSGRAEEANALRSGISVYERYKADILGEMFRDAGRGAFGIEPVAYYIYEKGEEIKRIRQIMYRLYLRDADIKE